ncbi:MAG: Phosphate regulon transcriptional regulatory protein PhoB [Alphaproteobacteria bacterium ADurb.Bin438]|nr:MAG: Phosphate regulon transcriptional regulatory protein PhoB [Alphaproteobacteria bacterium ADurb.Bin438]
MSSKILIIEDEEAIATMIKYNLEKEDFEVLTASSGEVGLNVAVANNVSLILLDWMLPNMSGIDFCKLARSRHELREVPIIMLTARSEDEDKIKSFSVGADDYITKPFSMQELIARVKAVLRRTAPMKEKGVIEFADLKVDLTTCKISRGDRYIHLGPTEYRLLQYLLKKPKHVFKREELLEKVWGANIHVELRTVDVHIRRLRKALNAGGEADIIRTVRTYGYAIDNEINQNDNQDLDE